FAVPFSAALLDQEELGSLADALAFREGCRLGGAGHGATTEVMRAAGGVELLPGDLHRQPLAPLAPTGRQHAPPTLRLHALAEAMGPLPPSVVRLECALHGILLGLELKRAGCIAACPEPVNSPRVPVPRTPLVYGIGRRSVWTLPRCEKKSR